jgi:hypothetical protein
MRFLSWPSLVFAIITVNAHPIEAPVVELFLPPVLGVNAVAATREAQNVVDKIYSEIGVRVVWKSAHSSPAGCTREPSHFRIVVTLQSEATASSSAAAMAFSNPYAAKGPCVTLLMDRLMGAIEKNPRRGGVLLGHVLAHEMGHVIEGIARHSESGLMKEGWSSIEILNLSSANGPRFTSIDSELVLNGLRFPTARPTIDSGWIQRREATLKESGSPVLSRNQREELK